MVETSPTTPQDTVPRLAQYFDPNVLGRTSAGVFTGVNLTTE